MKACSLRNRSGVFAYNSLVIVSRIYPLTAPPPKGRGFPELLSDMGHLLLQIGFARLWDLTIPALSVRFGA